MKYSYFLLTSAAIVLASPLPEGLIQGDNQQKPNPSGCVSQRKDPFGLVVCPTLLCLGNEDADTFGCNGQIQAPTSTQKKGSTITRTSITVVSILDCGSSLKQCHQPTTPLKSLTTSTKKSSSSSQRSSSPSKTSVITLPAITQIPDGQIQQPKTTTAPSRPRSSSKSVVTLPAITQIPDGQIQQRKTSPVPSRSQQSSKSVTTMPAITQIPDGQIQQPKSSTPSSPAKPTTTLAARPSLPLVSVFKDGQLQAPSARPSKPASTDLGLGACASNKTLSLTLENGVLKDANGWTGYIAANRQFQFDKPPQAGAVKVSGFSVCGNGSLALDGSTIFWECLSGDFYNLYDRSIAPYCRSITINAAQLLKC